MQAHEPTCSCLSLGRHLVKDRVPSALVPTRWDSYLHWETFTYAVACRSKWIYMTATAWHMPSFQGRPLQRLLNSKCNVTGMLGSQLWSEHGFNCGSDINVGGLYTNLWLSRHFYLCECMNWFKPTLEIETWYHRLKYSELKAKIRTQKKIMSAFCNTLTQKNTLVLFRVYILRLDKSPRLTYGPYKRHIFF